MHKTFLRFTVLAICVPLACPVRGQEPSSIDKLQSTVRTETTGSVQSFLHDICELDPKIQSRLLRARLTNATLNFNGRTQLQSDVSIQYRSGMCVQTGKKSWIVSSKFFRCLKAIKRGSGGEYCQRVLELKLEVEIKPNSDMAEWMQARDEYVEYSKNPVPDIRIVEFDFSGKIEGAALMKEPSEYFRGEPVYYDPPTYVLKLKLGQVSTGELAIEEIRGVREGTVRGHINFLREKIADWVKHYMGKGKKPQHIFEPQQFYEQYCSPVSDAPSHD